MNEPIESGTALTVRKTGLALSEGPSVLGERQVRLPIAGKIRPGIKALVSAHAKNPKAVAAYKAGVEAGKSFDEIDRELKSLLSVDKSVLTPRNVEYFTVRRGDFHGMPEIADRILAMYGEDRGDGRRLYRFPIVLPFDSWQAVMPHGLRCFTRSELVYWSEYGPDGARYCKTRAPVAMNQKTNRAVKPFGGRAVVLRAENNGLCDPDNCVQYQSAQCKLSGSLLVYIPGIHGTGAIEIPMTSFYALQGIRQQLELMLYLRGRISGLYAGKPMFYVSKRNDEVSMIDPDTGKPKKVRQWITALTGTADMTAMLTAPEEDVIEAEGNAAIAALEAPDDDIEPEPEPEAPKAMATKVYGKHVITEDGEIVGSVERGKGDDVAPFYTDRAEPEPDPQSEAELGATLKQIGQSLRALKISYALFEPYAAARYGDGWAKEAKLAAQVVADLKRVTAAGRDEFAAMVKRGATA